MQHSNIRNTKIIATLGPATDDPIVLEKLMLAGMDIARINMSHADNTLNAIRIKNLQHVAKKLNHRIDIFIDLPGHKIRIGKFVNKKINLLPGQKIILDPDLDPNSGTAESVYISYPNLYQDLL